MNPPRILEFSVTADLSLLRELSLRGEKLSSLMTIRSAAGEDRTHLLSRSVVLSRIHCTLQLLCSCFGLDSY